MGWIYPVLLIVGFTILVHVALACLDALGEVFFTSCVVSPGKEERKPASIALRSVEGKGGAQ